jgi:glucose/arabinose dehydrogenase
MSAAVRCAGALLVLCCAGAPARAQDDPPPQSPAQAQAANERRPPACDDDDGGLQLPAGFCALVVADDLGTARHLAVAGNGDIYVALVDPGGGVAALRDTDGDGRLEHVERFGDAGGTGIQLRDDYLYFAPNTLILRYRLTPGELVPKGAPERVVAGFPEQRSHAAKPFEIDADGWLYVNIGAPSNACQPVDRTPGAPGAEPCDQLDAYAGVWRFRADELNQAVPAAGKRYATGIRNGVANAWNGTTGKLYVVQHGRDQLAELWPEHYDDRQRAELPAEEMFEVQEGDDFGWPYCYYDPKQQKKVLAPEYGGDGVKVGRCEKTEAPLLAFPAHWAPNDLLFYTGTQFPERYRGGAFIAFHGSWNRQPYPQQGFRVVFVPFRDDRPAGDYETFADGRTVRTPAEARYRPAGLALGPDGSLYISDSRHGRIWRVLYRD